MRASIVAGVDGSDQALAAAHYAAGLARRKKAPLRLVYVFESMFYGFGPMYLTGGYGVGVADDQLRKAVSDTLGAIAREITQAYPDVEITSLVREGGASATLIAESQEAEVTVVGSRGLGGFAELVLGSVSSQVAAHGHGTVVVVRPGGVTGGPILIGFDGSRPAQAALEYAVSEALAQRVPLVVACVYWEEPWGFADEPETNTAIAAAHRAQALIEEAIKPWRERHPELRAEARTLHSLNPEHSLIEESAHAGMTVVGSRGRGGFTGLLLGSVSRTLVHHAHGPVAVVHSR
jgi:nucleotide-binding universal stress UspA family protein